MENILKKLLYTAAFLWCTIFLQGLIPVKMNHTELFHLPTLMHNSLFINNMYVTLLSSTCFEH